MQYNNEAQKLFSDDICNIKADDKYIIREKYDEFGRAYYCVSHFWHMDKNISVDTELSLLEWDGNEINIEFRSFELLKSKYIEAISILKSWKSQLEKYSDSKFCIILSYDNGDLMDEEDRVYSFSLRFWKERKGSEIISPINDYVQPVIVEYCN